MEKLLQLLNEYERSLGSDREWLGIIDEDGFFCTRKSKKENSIIQHSSLYEAILQIISKKFGFIQWLWSKGKIRYMEDWEFLGDDHGGSFTEYETRLMYLAIQDDPISFLVSILR